MQCPCVILSTVAWPALPYFSTLCQKWHDFWGKKLLNIKYVSDVICSNDISEEIQKRILAANRCFHDLRKHLRSHLTSKNSKILMYKVLIRPVLTYASETWTLFKTSERRLSLFERKVFRCIFGAKQENGTW